MTAPAGGMPPSGAAARPAGVPAIAPAFNSRPQFTANPTTTPTAKPAANLYAAPRAAVIDVEDEAELASRFQRLRAAIIDVMIYAVAFLPFAVFMHKPAVGMSLSALVFFGIIGWNGVLLARHGQTIGKKASGIRIVRTDDSDASFSRLFFMRMILTWVIGSVPVIGAVFSLVNVLFIFRDDRRCIHDLICDTKVVVAAQD